MGLENCAVSEMRFYDAELFESVIRGGRIHPCRLGKESVESHTLRVSFGQTCLDVVSAGPTMLYEGVMPEDCYTLSFVMRCPGGGSSFNFGTKFSAGWLGFFPPGATLDGYNPAGAVNALVTVPVKDFHEALDLYFPEMPSRFLHEGAAVELGQMDQQSLKSLIGLIVNLARQAENSEALQNVCLEYGRYLIPSSLLALRESVNGGVSQVNGRIVARHRKLRNVRDYIAGHFGEPLHIQDLCKVSGLSERGVENLFKDLIGVNPMAYLRRQRLAHAHRFLLSASPCSGKVKEAALNAGFWHMGRFAHYYASMFGEMPAQTLARAGSV